MDCHEHSKNVPAGRTRRATTLALSTLTAALLTLIPWSGTAVAHGSVVDPASRNYGCWDRWGDDFQNPAMADEDPMCWQAWQDNPNAMWNWNGLYRNGSAGDFEAVVPDGQLCSGGRTESGRYNSLDAVGPGRPPTSPTTSPSSCTTRPATAPTTSRSMSPSRASTRPPRP